MLSLERIYSIIEQTWGRMDIAPQKATAFARAIEREATAEATRIMRALIDAWESESDMQGSIDAIRDFVERMK